MLKAIETKYKGYRFRSRLEARWAVAFDAACIQWEYETEGFNLPSGYYLPDFWLPYEDAFLEVKPTKIDIDDSTLLVDLARESGHTVGALIGTPGYQFIPWMRFMSGERA